MATGNPSREVPFYDLELIHRPLRAKMERAFSECLRTCGFVGGDRLERFETEFARYCQTKACVGVSNGTDGLRAALQVLGVGPNDRVIVPAVTFVATAAAVIHRGAQPYFVDIDPESWTLDPRQLAELDDPAIKAMVPVHLYGQPADLPALTQIAKNKGWAVVEDAAQAQGASHSGRPVGSWGQLGVFSFYPGKNLGALGDAGAVVGQSQEMIEKLRTLVNHGRRSHDDVSIVGYNHRLDAFQAEVLTIKLSQLDRWNEQRVEIARGYQQRLASLPEVVTPKELENRRHVFHLYVVRIQERDVLRDRMKRLGIDTRVHYRKPLPNLEPFEALSRDSTGEQTTGLDRFPVALRFCEECLSLPMYPGLTERQMDRVTSVMRDHVKAGG